MQNDPDLWVENFLVAVFIFAFVMVILYRR